MITLVQRMIITPSESLRNEVAGHITRLKVREASQPLTVHYVAPPGRDRRGSRRPRRR